MCCSVLQCDAVRCSVVQRGVIWFCLVQCIHTTLPRRADVFARNSVCCSVLQCVTVCYSVLQCVAVCCSVLQCVADQTSNIQHCLVTLMHVRVTRFFFYKNLTSRAQYGVATISRLLKIIGLFCKKSPVKQTIFCKRDL